MGKTSGVRLRVQNNNETPLIHTLRHVCCANTRRCLLRAAGIGAFGMVDWLGMSAYRSVFEVNFFGMVAVTKAFLPMLMALDPTSRRRGRVVNMSSAAGTVAAPGWSPYAASKVCVLTNPSKPRSQSNTL